MRWGRFGVPIATIVFLFALGRISSVVVDWAWFSSIGYVGVFWTAFVTKAALFVVVFAVSTLLLWANATLAVRFASLLPGSAAFGPFAAVRALPGSPGLALSPLMWRLDWRAYDLAHIALAYGASENVVSPDLAMLLGRQPGSLFKFLENHRNVYSS